MRIVNLMDKLWSLSFVLVIFVQYSTQSPRQSTTTTAHPNAPSSSKPADVNAVNNGQLLNSDNSDSLSPSRSTISPKTTYVKTGEKDIVRRRNLNDKDMISVDKLIIVASIVSGAIVVLLVSLVVVYICRRKYSTKNSSLQTVGSVDAKHGEPQEVYSVNEEGVDAFMGIPPNNQIWKELQMLPSSSVVSGTNGDS